MVVVNEMGKRYGVAIGEGSDKVTLIFSQLDFHSRNKITNISTELNGAMVTLNLGLSCFYTLKYIQFLLLHDRFPALKSQV